MTDPKVRPQVRKHLDGRDWGPLGALALELARRIDDPKTSGVAPLARELRATLRELDTEHVGLVDDDLTDATSAQGAGAMPEEADGVDQLAAARAARRAAAQGL